MIWSHFLMDSINITQNVEVNTWTEYVDTCVDIAQNVPAALWCWESATRVFTCMPERITERDVCIEIQPIIELDCNFKNYIIEVIRNGCNLWLYRVDEIQPIRFVRGWLWSYYILAHRIKWAST